MKPMDSNEAVSIQVHACAFLMRTYMQIIQGTERFSRYSGYGRTLKYAGDYQDSNQVSPYMYTRRSTKVTYSVINGALL